MWLNGLLCLGDVLIFFLSTLLLVMSLFKSKDGDKKTQGRRLEAGCFGIWLFMLVAGFTACNWISFLPFLAFFKPDNNSLVGFMWIAMITGSTIIMILIGRGNAYETAQNRTFFVLGIISLEGGAGSVSATFGSLIGEWKSIGVLAQIPPADPTKAYFIGLLVSMAIGIFYLCVSLLITQDVDLNGLIATSWVIAAVAGGAVGGALYGNLWGGVAGGIIGVIAGTISLRKFMEKQYLDFLKSEELSSITRSWDR